MSNIVIIYSKWSEYLIFGNPKSRIFEYDAAKFTQAAIYFKIS